jgi:hypothetical protein
MVDPERYWNLAAGPSTSRPPHSARRWITVERLPGGCTLYRPPSWEPASGKQATPPEAPPRNRMVKRHATKGG